MLQFISKIRVNIEHDKLKFIKSSRTGLLILVTARKNFDAILVITLATILLASNRPSASVVNLCRSCYTSSGATICLALVALSSVIPTTAATNYCKADGEGLPADGVRVVLLYSEFNSSSAVDVQSKLLATRAFAAVDLFDAGRTTPALSDLQRYTAALVWRGPGVQFASASAVGDVLAQYWDGGGAVVTAEQALESGNFQGRFWTPSNSYMLIDGSGGNGAPSDALGAVFEPESPLMADASALSAASAQRSLGGVINGGVVVCRWASDGRPLIVRGTRAGRPLVALNMYPVSSSVNGVGWSGDGASLMRNALFYSACSTCGAGTLTTAQGQSLPTEYRCTIKVGFNSTGL